jgi:hypothetical protein
MGVCTPAYLAGTRWIERAIVESTRSAAVPGDGGMDEPTLQPRQCASLVCVGVGWAGQEGSEGVTCASLPSVDHTISEGFLSVSPASVSSFLRRA